MPASKYLFSGKDITCVRGGRVLFQGVSCRVRAGEVLHITGVNGSGKTSFLRIAAGALAPREGTVEPAVGMTFIPASDTHLKGAETPREHLSFWANMYGEHEKNCAGALKKMALTRLQDTPIRYLSSGQRRRLCLAQLFLRDAPLWILDEPLSGLDQEARGLLWQHVEAHTAKGGAVMVASHEEIPCTHTLRIGEAR